MTILAGDLGGTKTVLALISADKGPREPTVELTYPSRDYANLLDIISQFLAENEERLKGDNLEAAVIGVAGPIIDGVANITNLGWRFDRFSIAQTLALPEEKVRLLNDLEALATAVPHLQAADQQVLNAGVRVPHSPIAVVAPGTGLGEAFLIWNGQHYTAYASEGGHTGFTPGDKVHLELIAYLMETHHHVSSERVCSGLGIQNIYQFLLEKKQVEVPDWLRRQIANAKDATPIIISNAISSNPEAICRQTVELFVSALAVEASNLGLTILSRGGVYLGGGIPPRILDYLVDPAFLQAFQNKGRFRNMLEDMPVSVILNSKAPLLGAGYAALTLIE